jgi:uncharacterized protein (DUF305 family)
MKTGWKLAIGAALALAALAVGLLIGVVTRSDDGDINAPANDGPEAGFARDMSVHHAQAVDMAGRVVARTNDADLKLLANDILLTQQGQIGVMNGWLQAWYLPASSAEPSMAWMGMPTNGPMPGMASADDVKSLSTLPVDEVEVKFLQLMITHHQGGIQMAQGAIELTDRPEVVRLAQTIIDSQTGELKVMTDMLEARGASVPEPLPEMDMSHAAHAQSGS